MPMKEATLKRAAELAAAAILPARAASRELALDELARIIRNAFLQAESEEARQASVVPMTAREEPYLVGLCAGRCAVTPIPPYPPGSPAAEEWTVGYGAGISRPRHEP